MYFREKKGVDNSQGLGVRRVIERLHVREKERDLKIEMPKIGWRGFGFESI